MTLSHDDYLGRDAVGLAELVADGETSPAELLDTARAIADRVNPAINALNIDMDARARKACSAPVPTGPLAGVPFLLKDLHILVTGERTTNGSRLFAERVADHDSELTVRYDAAGLVSFARTHSPEFGLTTTTESRLFGQTKNPWNLEHTSGGSSGGASAAVAAGIVPAANASDGGGSIRIPASCCGLFGLKPTRARTPLGPDVGEGWAGMSTVHAVTRSVRDSAALLDATAGPDVGAPYHPTAPPRPFLEEVGAPVGKLRIGLQTESFNGQPTDPACRRAAEEAGALCERLGHVVTEVRHEPAPELFQATTRIIAANIRNVVMQRVAELGRELQDEDIEGMTRVMVDSAAAFPIESYPHAVGVMHAGSRAFARFMGDLDVLLTPTMAVPPPRLGAHALDNPDLRGATEVLRSTIAYTSLLNATGNPAMSVPLHVGEAGLPIGVQFVGQYGDEAGLLRLAAQLEEAQPWFDRRPPTFG